MRTPAGRPDEAALRKFLLGALPPAEAEAVARWVESAPGAAGVLSRIDARDTIVDALGRTAADAPAPPAVPGLPAAVGDYRLVRELGRGGMGVVLEAENRLTGARVALKLIGADLAGRATARARFVAEARAAARICHPNVVPVLHVGEDAGRPYLVMPLLNGETLDAKLKRVTRLPAAELAAVARDVAAGLAAAHAAGLVHRDVKPANVWLDADTGRARVLDFGLAKLLTAADELTRPGAVLGTLHYMAPEQADGAPVDARADLFGLGCVLFHAATGRRPFDGDTALAVLFAVKFHAPPPGALAALPPHLAALVRALLAKAPADRPASAAAAIAALDAPPTPPRKRARAVAAIVVATAVAAVAARGAAALLTLVKPSDAFSVQAQNGNTPAHTPAAPDGRATGKSAGQAPPAEPVPARATTPGEPLRAAAGAVAASAAYDDRSLVEFVLTFGGNVGVRFDGIEVGVTDPKRLPKRGAPLQVVGLALMHARLPGDEWGRFAGGRNLRSLTVSGAGFTDAECANFAGNTGLRTLVLTGTGVSDAGLAPFGACLELETLRLGGTRLTSDGLEHFRRCKKLGDLDLANTEVTNSGLGHLGGCPDLWSLNLSDCPFVTGAGLVAFAGCADLQRVFLNRCERLTDAGLEHLAGCRKLTLLAVTRNRAVTDAGLAHFAGCTELVHVLLSETGATDAALARFATCPKLFSLTVDHCPGVTDAGLAHLRGCRALAQLDLRGTKVTAAGVAGLAQALPKCRIDWDGGVAGPRN